MQIIEKIVLKSKGNKEYECHLNNGDRFMLHEDVLVKMGLYKGQQLTEEETEQLAIESSFRKVYHKALSYLSYRMRSKKEMEDYLGKNEYPFSIIKKVIERLKKEGHINDRDFAEAFVRTKINTTMSGPGKIKYDLMKKGIDEQDALQALDHYSKEQQLEQAKKLIQKRMLHNKRVSHKELQQKAKQFLLQKGFTFDMIEEAFNKLEIEKDTEEEMQALQKQGEKAMKRYRHLDSFTFQSKMKGYLYKKGFSISDIDHYLSSIHHED